MMFYVLNFEFLSRTEIFLQEMGQNKIHYVHIDNVDQVIGFKNVKFKIFRLNF